MNQAAAAYVNAIYSIDFPFSKQLYYSNFHLKFHNQNYVAWVANICWNWKLEYFSGVKTIINAWICFNSTGFVINFGHEAYTISSFSNIIVFHPSLNN